jgi:hypothetical protein
VPSKPADCLQFDHFGPVGWPKIVRDQGQARALSTGTKLANIISGMAPTLKYGDQSEVLCLDEVLEMFD